MTFVDCDRFHSDAQKQVLKKAIRSHAAKASCRPDRKLRKIARRRTDAERKMSLSAPAALSDMDSTTSMPGSHCEKGTVPELSPANGVHSELAGMQRALPNTKEDVQMQQTHSQQSSSDLVCAPSATHANASPIQQLRTVIQVSALSQSPEACREGHNTMPQPLNHRPSCVPSWATHRNVDDDTDVCQERAMGKK